MPWEGRLNLLRGRIMIRIASLVGLSIVLAGCAPTPLPPSRSAGPSAEDQPAREDDEAIPDASEAAIVRISDDIRAACKLSESEAYFAYDSARVSTPGLDLLEALAQCFSRGPLIGKSMRIVGHADPRGHDEYNLVLGSRRADSVQQALIEKGMTAERITTTSRGEMDARGSDEPGWAQDRRVDVLLGNSEP